MVRNSDCFLAFPIHELSYSSQIGTESLTVSPCMSYRVCRSIRARTISSHVPDFGRRPALDRVYLGRVLPPELNPVSTKTLDYAPGCSSRDRPYLRPGVLGSQHPRVVAPVGGCTYATLENDPGRSSVLCHRRLPRRQRPRQFRLRNPCEGRRRSPRQVVVFRICAGRLLESSSLSGGSVRGHNYTWLARFGRRVHGNSNNERRGSRHRCRFCRSSRSLKRRRRTRTPSPAGAWVPIAF